MLDTSLVKKQCRQGKIGPQKVFHLGDLTATMMVRMVAPILPRSFFSFQMSHEFPYFERSRKMS